MTVEHQPGLDPERIARAESARHQAGRLSGGQQPLEDRLAVFRGGKKLEAVLAGVSGAGRGDLKPADRSPGDAEALDTSERRLRDARRDRHRLRPLYRDHRGRIAEIRELGADSAV